MVFFGPRVEGRGCCFTPDDSHMDRLNRLWTASGLMLCSALLVLANFLTTPTNCWCPAYFTTNHENYANKACWMTQTFYFPDNTSLGGESGPLRQHVAYYRWVPAVLLCQGLVFILPYIFWRLFCHLSPLKLVAMSESAKRGQYSCCESERRALVNYLSSCLRSSVDDMKRHNPFPLLSVLYLLTKLMYIFVCCGQLIFLDWFLEWDRYPYGIQIIYDLIKGWSWGYSPILPRIILCDFSIRQLGNVHRHTVQCAVTINMLSEGFFIFIWFWLSLLLIINLYSLFYWVLAYISSSGRRAFLRRLIHAARRSSATRGDTQRLTWGLHGDDMAADAGLTLALLAENTDEALVSEVLGALLLDTANIMYPDASNDPDVPLGPNTIDENRRVEPGAPPEESIPLYPSLNRSGAYQGQCDTSEKNGRVVY